MSPTARMKTSPRRSLRTANRATRSQESTPIPVAIPAVIARNPEAARGTARRGRPRRNFASTSTAATPPHVEETAQLSVADVTPPVPDVDETVPMPITPEALNNNGESSVQVLDLITPQPPLAQPTRRPVEVDLTCDLDDEVLVVMEDVVNPSHRANAFANAFGTSSQRARVNVEPLRNLGSAFGDRRRDAPVPCEIELHVDSSPSSEVAPGPALAPSPKEDAYGIQCPICFETLSKIKEANRQMHTTTCGHLFCGPCITKALANTQECPTCRKQQNIRKIHPVFL